METQSWEKNVKLLSEIAEVNLAFNKIIDIDKGELDQVSEQDGVLDDFLEDLETVKKMDQNNLINFNEEMF